MAEITQKLGFDAQQAITTLDRLTGALGGANAALSKMKGAASGAKTLSGVTEGTKKATKAANEFLVGWKTIIRVLETQLVVRGLNTLITGLKDAVENARELGLAIEEVRTIDALGRTAEDINKSVLDLSDAIGQAPTDLAEGLYQTLSNQVVEAADSFQFMSEAARLAKVTASETGDAVNALSSVMNSYNLAASEAEHVAGTLFATVEQGRLRLGEIANVIGRVTPLTAQLGITWEETAASIATMTRQGVRADTAITQLRAVVTRLLKPTSEMSAIFRKWGVEDGRQAILTFGGLTGVLKKLAQETGHNSGEMSELLRNVRAIAGVFGIMSNEGKTMTEVLGHIEGATKKATAAWAEYAKSDAQKLTVEMQKFDNQLTRVGTKSIPLVTGALSAVNTFVEAQGKGIQILTGQWGAVEQAAARYEQAVRQGANEGLELQKKQADAGRDQYDVLTEASRLYYAEANILENQLADTRDNAIAGATAAFELAADNLTDLYKDSLTEIERFADAAAGNVVKAFDRIADLERDIENQKLDYRLKQAKGFYEKLAVLDKAHQEASKKRDAALLKITADPASEEAFREASKHVIALAERKLRLGEREKANAQVIYDLTIGVIEAQEKAKQGQIRFAAASENVAGSSGDIKRAFADIGVRVKGIVSRVKEIHEDSIIDPNEKVELKSLGVEFDKLQAKFKKGAAALSAAGLDLDFAQVVDDLTDAFNQAHKDWATEVNEAKAEFAKAVIPIKISLDPGGALAELQKVLDLQQIPGESQAALAARTDEAAKTTLETHEDIQNKINVLRKAGNKPLRESADLVAEIAETTGQAGTLIDQSLGKNAGMLEVLLKIASVHTQSREETEAQTVEAVALEQAYSNLLTRAQEGGGINRNNLETMKQQVLTLREERKITESQKALYDQLNKQIDGRLESEERIAELKEQLPSEEEVEAAEAVLAAKLNILRANEFEAKQQEEIKKRDEVRVKVLGEAKKVTEDTANAAEKTANATGNASTQAGNFTSNIGKANEPLGFVVLQTRELAQLFERAAIAAASLAGTTIPAAAAAAAPSSYHGGAHYADGGVFRGQDRQLTALARGETVVNRKQSRKFFSELNAMNQGSQPVYRDQGGPVTNVGDVNVTVQGGDSSQQTVREIGHALRREVKRGNIMLR